MENDNNEIIEINSDNEKTSSYDTVSIEKEDEIIVTPKKNKNSKKEFFYNKLSKKGKIIFWITLSVILLAIIGILLYFLVFKKSDKKDVIKEESVVIEHDNYIYDNGNLKLLNTNGKEIGTYKCKVKDEKKCFVANLSSEDNFDIPKYVDDKKEEIEQVSKIYNNRFVFINDDNKITLYDISSKTSSGEYKLIKSSSSVENLIVAKNSDDKYGIININLTNADTLLDFEYEHLGIINSSKAFVATDGAYSYLIDDNNEALTAKVKGEIRKFSDKYISVYDDGYKLYDYSGKMYLSDKNEFIDFYNNYILIINDQKMVIYNTDLIKLNEVGIKLKNKNYNTIYTIENGKSVKTEKAYTLTEEESNLRVVLNETSSKLININEGLINNNIKYVNYFDGVLYFYSDEEKTQYIGSYTCTYKNDVKSSSEMFETCFIAKESNLFYNQDIYGYAPIFNGGYVLIKDSKAEGKNTIVLYDILNASQKAKYQAVDTGISSLEVSSVTSLNSLVVAKNTDSNMGIITFGVDGPTGVIKFKEDGEGTKKISLMGDNLYVERDSTNFLYTKLGVKLATSKFKIISYEKGYTVVQNSSKYLLYKMASSGESGEIVSNELDHIKLDSDFFIGMNDHKLNLYKYSDGKKGILKDDLNIQKDVKFDDISASKTNDGYEIKVKESDGGVKSYNYTNDGTIKENKEIEENNEE